MRPLVLFVAAAIACASCGDSVGARIGGSSLTSPDPASSVIDVRLSPERFTLTPFGLASCAFGREFGTTFDLIASSGFSANLDRVTLHLLDGTNVGPSILLPSPVLSGMFSSTTVFGTRTFRFSPRFGCLATPPRFLLVELLFREVSGRTRPFTLRASF